MQSVIWGIRPEGRCLLSSKSLLGKKKCMSRLHTYIMLHLFVYLDVCLPFPFFSAHSFPVSTQKVIWPYNFCVHVHMCLAKLLPVQGQDFIKTQIRRRETGNPIRLMHTSFSRPPHQSCAYTFALILFGKTKTSQKLKGEQSLGLRCAMTSDKALSSESSAVRILPRDTFTQHT